MEGVVLRSYGGFCYVKTTEDYWDCNLRGRSRWLQEKILPGDRVRISVISRNNKNKGIVENILPRETELLRPPVANVQQVVVIMALVNPPVNLTLLDRYLILARFAHIRVVICFNKIDLVDGGTYKHLQNLYSSIGYQVLVTSAKSAWGVENLQGVLKNQISVFAGPSGVGKSSLLNMVQPGLLLKTNEVSQKTKRGRHTTRHVELLELEIGGLVADTPGFSKVYLPVIVRNELADYFPELNQIRNNCRFSSCLHHHEPSCAVKAAVATGEINPGRYAHYLEFLAEVIAGEEHY